MISKFTHKRIKRHDGQLLVFTQGSNPDGNPVQDAFVEDLLCAACESRLQKWEDHAARMLGQKKIFDFQPTKPRQFKKLEGFDYAKMKLFLLSILWRMGASKQEAFSPVMLGPHSERIGKMLLAGNPGEVTEYGCAITVVHMDGERAEITRPANSIMYPAQNLRMYRALIDGLLLAWLVGSQKHMAGFQAPGLLLQKDGTWLTHSDDWNNIAFMRHELGELSQRFTK